MGHYFFIVVISLYWHLFQASSISQAPPSTFSHILMTLLCINHFPSHTAAAAAAHYHDDKNVLDTTIMMMCEMSSLQFHFEALLVPEEKGNIERREGWHMFSGEGGGEGGSWFVTCRWLPWRHVFFFFLRTMMEPMGYRNGWDRDGKWLVGDISSLCVCDFNVMGGDGCHLRSPSFNRNDKGRPPLPPLFTPTFTVPTPLSRSGVKPVER